MSENGNHKIFDNPAVRKDAWLPSRIIMTEEIKRLEAENKDLHERVAALESQEVCTKPHDLVDFEGCPYCRIERLLEDAI